MEGEGNRRSVIERRDNKGNMEKCRCESNSTKTGTESDLVR